MGDTVTGALWTILFALVAIAFVIASRGGDPTALTGVFTSVFAIAVFAALGWRFIEAAGM